jgi:hypothetical protein
MENLDSNWLTDSETPKKTSNINIKDLASKFFNSDPHLWTYKKTEREGYIMNMSLIR